MTNQARQFIHSMPREILISTTLCIVLSLWCIVETRRSHAARDAYTARLNQVEQMSSDAQAIQALRDAPQLASERERPNDELLVEIRSAMDNASIPLERWVGNDPSQPVRMPQTPYKQLSTRLSFENLETKDIVGLVYNMMRANPGLSIPYVRLSAGRQGQDRSWDTVVTTSYLIYAPYQGDPMGPPT